LKNLNYKRVWGNLLGSKCLRKDLDDKINGTELIDEEKKGRGQNRLGKENALDIAKKVKPAAITLGKVGKSDIYKSCKLSKVEEDGSASRGGGQKNDLYQG